MSKDRDKGHDHEGHDHEEHGHGAHEHHDHDAHEGHDHGAHEPHDHEAHDSHAHEHAAHEHAAHEHHVHDDHEGHDHEGHDHDEHAGHGHGHHGHGHHDHDHAHDLRGASKRSLGWALVLIGGFMFVEVIGAVISGSLALLADAGHMLTDAAAIVLALVAMWLSKRPASVGSTFGYHRTEVLAALLNTLSLWLIAGWIFFEAYHRFRDVPEIEGGILFGVGFVGLLVNIAAAWILHSASGESLNVEGAFWHVMADLLGSVGVIISAILVLAFEWYIADPIISIVIGLLILYSSWSLFMRLFRVLLEGTPDNVDIYRLCSDLEDVAGVTLVHDVHAWTITSGYHAFTAHVILDPSHEEDRDHMLDRLRRIARGFGLTHVTLQLEHSTGECTHETHHVEHLEARSAS